MPRLRAPTRRVQGRSPTNWGRAIFGLVAVPASTKVLLGSFALENPGIEETVRRTMGRMFVQSDQFAIIESQFGALGFAVVTDQALAAGVASFPGPVTDAASDSWFVWEPILQSTAGSDGGGINIIPPVATNYHSKGMRKVPDGFVVAIIAENAVATSDFEIAISISLLASRTR